MNLPNKISVARICLIPVFVVLFFLKALPCNYLIAGVVFLVAALTDFVDGHIARSRKLVTNLGKFLDPIADKVLVSTAFILLLVAKDDVFGKLDDATDIIYIIVAISVCIIMARELIISAFRQIAAEKLGKYKTATQDACIFIIMVSASIEGTVGLVLLWTGLACFTVATVLTIISGFSYVLKNKQVLKDKE